MQVRILDFMAISMGIVAGVRPAALLLQPVRPPRRLCTLKNYILIAETVLIACIFIFGCARLLMSQPWFTGGNGRHDNVRLLSAVTVQSVFAWYDHMSGCMLCMLCAHILSCLHGVK